ncbi:hypothetical protein IAU60_003338 [Kwoniella sp. DSM 27419]
MLVQDIEQIRDGVHNGLYALRVTDANSICRLDHVDGFSASSSFTTADLKEEKDFRYVEQNFQWRVSTRKLERHLDDGCPQDKRVETPFISTSLSLDWSIWEIARRLVQSEVPSVSLNVIRREQVQQLQRGFEPLPLLREQKRSAAFCTDGIRAGLEDEDEAMYSRIIASVAASDTLVYYGRIFPEDILETTVWDRETPGFPLQPRYYKPEADWCDGSTWIDRLVWDPTDSYEEAAGKIYRRSRKHRGARPFKRVNFAENAYVRMYEPSQRKE